jgi:tRNA threonylcarbamoyladenosine biosynthesis protein TsaB
LAMIDARHGEAFLAAYAARNELISPRALAPEDLGSIVTQAKGRWLAVGDGAVRYRRYLETAGVLVPEDLSPLHEVSAEAICSLGVSIPAVTADETIVPDYRRRPDAEIALAARESRLEGAER